MCNRVKTQKPTRNKPERAGNLPCVSAPRAPRNHPQSTPQSRKVLNVDGYLVRLKCSGLRWGVMSQPVGKIIENDVPATPTSQCQFRLHPPRSTNNIPLSCSTNDFQECLCGCQSIVDLQPPRIWTHTITFYNCPKPARKSMEKVSGYVRAPKWFLIIYCFGLIRYSNICNLSQRAKLPSIQVISSFIASFSFGPCTLIWPI